MTSPVAGIDPHQRTFTVGIVDQRGVELVNETFDNNASGYVDAIDLLTTHRVQHVGVEGSASWGAHDRSRRRRGWIRRQGSSFVAKCCATSFATVGQD